MKTKSKDELGKEGEEIAVKHLVEKGFKILERNWRFHHREVDIIAMDSKDLVVVEVKTRANDFYGDPVESINFHKQDFLISAAEAYLFSRSINSSIRFDVITILMEQGKITLNHIEDAFYPRVKRR